MVRQFEVYLVSLGPTHGSEIKKTRPALVISPNEMNQTLKTVLVAPMTTTLRHFPSRVETTFHGKKGDIALDQMRAIDRSRLVKKLGGIHHAAATKTLAVLQEMFSNSAQETWIGKTIA